MKPHGPVAILYYITNKCSIQAVNNGKKEGGNTLAKRTNRHGCLYTLIILPIELPFWFLGLALKLVLYLALYAVIFCFYAAWFLISGVFKLIWNLIFHKGTGFRTVCGTGEEYEAM